MKKKEIVVHMTTPKTGRVGFFKRIQLVPILLCLLASVLIWLFVENLKNPEVPDPFSPSDGVTESDTEGAAG